MTLSRARWLVGALIPAAASGVGLLCAWSTPTEGQVPPSTIPDTVPFSEQRPGNPDAGLRALLSKGWVGCGVPATYYDWARAVLSGWLKEKLTPIPAPEVSSRPQGDEDLPYFLNRFRTKDGFDALTPNCLLCHAGRINGKLVLGLGNADGQYELFGSEVERAAKLIQWGSWLYFWSPARRAEMKKVGDRVAAVAPYLGVAVEGGNPTHSLAWALVMHRDPQTLTWSDEPVIQRPPLTGPPNDVPPWWRMSKKYAMFAAAGGQGDHTGFMAVNSTLCVDDVANYDALYTYFNDIRAYLASIKPPPYPFKIDRALADQGAQVFKEHCEHCHGSYGEGGQYPNRLVPLEKIGTDPALAQFNVVTGAPATEWLNSSVFTRHGSYNPYLAYVAPPLDGIWATAPFLHNGSVPTVAALLDSTTRPKYWTRSYDSSDYDRTAVGWLYQALDHGQAGESDAAARQRIVDTTLAGYSNAGHTYGDSLSPPARTAVIEYLKTL